MMLTPLIQSFRPSVCSAEWRGFLPHLARRHEPVLAEQEHFRLKLAETPAEVAAAQKLRYRVFKQEQGRLANCNDGIDRDRFDRHCRHLIVTEKERGRIVGTYRVLSGAGAAAAGGFYSEEEFEVHGLRQLRGEVCEVGRSCVDPEFRSGAVVALLWSGLGALRRRPEPGARLAAPLRRAAAFGKTGVPLPVRLRESGRTRSGSPRWRFTNISSAMR